MTGFELRIKRAEAFEMKIEAYLTRVSDAVAKNGTEHTHPLFVDKIRRMRTDAAKFVRFAPDGVMLRRGDVKHWEAKLSRNLEKDAYETYLKYEDMGSKVAVFFGINDSPLTIDALTMVYWQHAHRIGFVSSELVVGRYPENRRFPVIDGWICPRARNGCLDYDIGSGTPYREVDVSSLNLIGPLSALSDS